MTPLYKFIRDPEVSKLVCAGKLKFSPISELNDPSEMSAPVTFEDIISSMDLLRKNGYTSEGIEDLKRQEALFDCLVPGMKAISAPSSAHVATQIIRGSFFDNLEELVSRLNQMSLKLSERVGYLCLTRSFRSLPMWAHYAGNAKGAVIEFNNLDHCFNGHKSGVLNELKSVKYTETRRGVTFEPYSYESLFFHKFEDWRYEQEVRVVKRLCDCQEIEGGNGKSVFIHEIPLSHISKVIFGWNTDENLVKSLLATLKDINQNVEIFKVNFKHGEFHLKTLI